MPNFFTALKMSQSEWYVSESQYLESNYNFTFADPMLVKRLELDVKK